MRKSGSLLSTILYIVGGVVIVGVVAYATRSLWLPKVQQAFHSSVSASPTPTSTSLPGTVSVGSISTITPSSSSITTLTPSPSPSASKDLVSGPLPTTGPADTLVIIAVVSGAIMVLGYYFSLKRRFNARVHNVDII